MAIYRRTGTPIHPMSPLVKLAWLRDEQPKLFAAAARFIGIKEYVFFRLFGRYVVDHSIASATGCSISRSSTGTTARSTSRASAASGSPRSCPRPISSKAWTASVAAELGIDAATPFVVGANDGALSNVGVNAIQPGEVAITIGTSGAMRTVVDQPATDPQGRTFCYALTDRHWVIGGPVNNGGIIFRWVRDEIAASECETAKRLGIDPYDVLTRIAERVPPGSEGLIFHPYLTGERAPMWNAEPARIVLRPRGCTTARST